MAVTMKCTNCGNEGRKYSPLRLGRICGKCRKGRYAETNARGKIIGMKRRKYPEDKS